MSHTEEGDPFMQSVLIIDDDEDIRELMTWRLHSAGYETIGASDGAAGLTAVLDAAAAGAPPDLILVDWMMPKLTGIEVCQALRGNPGTARIPIILVTAKAHEAEVERGFAAGVDDYILKPFSPRELLGRVNAVLARTAVVA
ncbi:MAG TPA: response regulator [Acidimicrobiales bacterium]|jgi:DNA-binding response OmpR family regulator|nr:response regulator [Acidimicrobiales bacterium]